MTWFITFTEGNKVIDTTAWKLYQVFKEGGEEFFVDDAGDERDYKFHTLWPHSYPLRLD